MDRKTLVAITICFAILALWQKYYIEPRTRPQQVQTQAQPISPTAQTPSGTGTALTPPTQKSKPVETAPLQTGTGEVLISNGPRLISNWALKSYRVGLTAETAAVDLASITNEDGDIELAFDDPALAYLTRVQGTLSTTAKGTLWTYEDANVKITRETSAAPDQNYVTVQVTAQFKNKAPAYGFVSLLAQGKDDDKEAQDRQLLYFTNNEITRKVLKDSVERTDIATPIKYVGAANRYFLMAVLPQGGAEPKALLQPGAVAHSGRLSLVYPVSGNSITIPLKVFFGPKDLQTLRSVDPALDHTVDLGWFTWFAYPLLKLLQWFYQYVKNYGVAIILLTLLLKIVTYPLTYKSMKSMKEMARIQPQLQRLREKYKDDKEALNREMLTLMRSHGYNPMAGCLPILIQMPIFFALYRVLYSSIELYHAPFTLWIHDLSAHDPFYVTPILLTVTMFIQQKLTPSTATDPAQQKMMQFMPIMFGVLMINLPSGLTLYMLVNALASIVQQIILNKKLNVGHVQPVPARAR